MAMCCASMTGQVVGTLYLTQDRISEPTVIRGTLKGEGLKVGQKHAIAIHCYGEIDDIGPIFNPFGKRHGAPDDEERKVGNLGNIYVGNKAEDEIICNVHLVDKCVKLIGAQSVIGRSIALYSEEDDFGHGGAELSLFNGDVGSYISCGIIGIHCGINGLDQR